MPFWWTGASYFRELDMEEEEDENDYRRWGPGMVRGMIRGVGPPKHPALVKNFSVIDIERELLIQKQLDCSTFGAIYTAVEAVDRGENAVRVVAQNAQEYPEQFQMRRPDAVAKTSERYELVDGVLARRVYDVWDHEIQLRVVAPTGAIGKYEHAGRGARPLDALGDGGPQRDGLPRPARRPGRVLQRRALRVPAPVSYTHLRAHETDS